MKESKKASDGKENKNNPDNEKEHDGKEKKKEKKKHHFLYKIPEWCKDLWKKRKHKKKSHSNEAPLLSSAVEMQPVASMVEQYNNAHDEQTEEVNALLEGTEQLNVQDEQNLKDCDTFPAQGSILAQLLKTLANAMKKKPMLAKMYEVQSQYVIRRALKDDLEINDIHFLLDWIQTTYPNFLRKHINEPQLEELLSTDEISDLQDKYQRKQNEILKKWWQNALAKEEERWEQDPDNLSEFSHNILQMFNGVLTAAKEISEDFVSRLMPMVESEFLQLLNRYKSSFKKYHEKKQTKSHLRKITMDNMNYCSDFRDFVHCASTNEDGKQKINLILQKIKEEGEGILLQDLFPKIECDVKKLRTAKGLTSLEIMRDNISDATEHLSSLSTLSDKCRQGIAAKIHMHLVTKYLEEIKNIRKCNRAEQKALATQMDETVKLLIQFCNVHLNDDQQKDADWANNVIRKIAEIIRCEDLEAIKLSVGALAEECPDIRKRHVKSFLCIKNHLWDSQRMLAVKVLDNYSNREVPKGRRLFTFIRCWPCHCLIL